MKKLLTLFVLLPHLLFSQEHPIIKQEKNLGYICSVEQQFTQSKIKAKSTRVMYSQTQKEAIDPIQYLLTHDYYEIESFLRDYNQSGKTDIFSDQNAMKVVQYFKNELIQKIDGQLSDPNPAKFIEYFRSYDAIAWYQPDVTLYEPFIDELFKSLEILYNYEPYWEKTENLNGLRWGATLLMDIERHRSKVYDLFVLVLEKSTDDYIGTGIPQTGHVNALSSIVWRAFMNGDSEFITKFLNDQHAIDLYFGVIDSNFLVGDFDWIISNFINPVHIILKRAVEEPNYDESNLFDMVSERFNATAFGQNKHIYWISTLIRVNYDFGIDMNKIKSDYFNLEFKNTYSYDDNSIKIYSSIDSIKVQGIYLGLRQTRANFFKLTGNTQPLNSDTNNSINIYIFSDSEKYSTLGSMLFGIPTNNGGIYIEDKSALYTFDRDGDYLPIDFLVNHEYGHYLDGRYNIEGTFAQSDFYDWSKSVFWVEGLASFVASAKSRYGFGIAYSNAYQIVVDIEQNETLTLKESIKTSYNNPKMYPYSEAAWGFLYKNANANLLQMIELLKSNDISLLFSRLDEIANNQHLEPLYQLYLKDIKTQFENGLTDHDPIGSYDYSKHEISSDSIQFAFEKMGLSDFKLEQSYNNPFKYIVARKDTVVTEVKNINTYLESIIKRTDTIDSSYYSGYKILSAQVDSYEKVSNGYSIQYSIELPLNGYFYVEEQQEDPTDPPSDPIDPPTDPTDPDPKPEEPVITEIILYPNPTVSEINVINLPIYSQIYIYDTGGKIKHVSEHIKGDFRLDVSNYTSGLYILSWVQPGISRGSIKFIKN